MSASLSSQNARRVAVDPVALSRAATLITVMAKESGLAADERDQLTLVVGRETITVAMELRHALDGEVSAPRTFSFRIAVAAADQGGETEAVALRIRGSALIRALRLFPRSDARDYGILSPDTPVELSVAIQDNVPTGITLTPGGDTEVRKVAALGAGDLRMADAPLLAETPTEMQDLDVDALVELGGIANPRVGILLDPTHGVIAGVHRGRLLTTSFRGTGGAGADLGLFDAGKPSAQAVVLSPRLATAAGLAQLSAEDAIKTLQRAENARHALSVQAAAVAATLSVEPSARGELQRLLGAHAVAKARKAVKGDSEATRSVAFAKGLLFAAPDMGEAPGLSTAFAGAKRVPQGDLQVVRAAAGGDALVTAIACAWLGAGDREAFELTCEGLVGELRVQAEAARRGEDAHLGESVYARTALEVMGRTAAREAGVLHRAVSADHADAWWDAFGAALESLSVPTDAIEHLMRARGEAPGEARLEIPSEMRQRWLDEAAQPVRGRIWAGEGGQAILGFTAPAIGTVTASDTALVPDPQAFPLQGRAIAEVVDGHAEGAFRAEVFTSDLLAVANRAVGSSEVPVLGGEQECVFVCRWIPAGDLAPELPDSNRVAVEGVGDFSLDRSAAEPVETHGVAGTLAVAGVHAAGGQAILRLPLAQAPAVEAGAEGPIQFAIDADRLHDIVAFVAQRGRKAQITLEGRAVHLSVGGGKRLVSVPTMAAPELSQRLSERLSAMGVRVGEENLPLDEMFRALRKAEAERRSDLTVAQDMAEAGPAVQLPPIAPAGPVEQLKRRVGRLRQKLAFFRDEKKRMSGQRDLFGNLVDSTPKLDATLKRLQREIDAAEATAAEMEELTGGQPTLEAEAVQRRVQVRR